MVLLRQVTGQMCVVLVTKNSRFLTAPYIKQCREDDPLLTDCIVKAIDHLRPYLKSGEYNS